MGRAKQYQIEQEEYGHQIPVNKEVCADHFKSKFLKKIIQENSSMATCSYCKKKTHVCDLEFLFKYISEKIHLYYGGYDDANLYLASSFKDDDDDDDMSYGKELGSYLAPLNTEFYESTEDLLTHLDVLEDNEDFNSDLCSCFTNEEWVDIDPGGLKENDEMMISWEHFEALVKHQQRFFFYKQLFSASPSKENGLLDILTELSSVIRENSLLIDIDVNTAIYRCRYVSKGQKIKNINDITSPPDRFAKQNRMSPAGISMFYGAFDQDTATIESNPNNKALIPIIGMFKPKRNLKVLDLTKIPQPDFWNPQNSWRRIKFLLEFHNRLTRPIKRDDFVHIDYIPSQVFTEYLRYMIRDEKDKSIDGIIYRSSLSGAKDNIVLFCNQHSSKNLLSLESLKETTANH